MRSPRGASGAYTRGLVKAARSIVFAGALAALGACDAERTLAIAKALDAGGDQGDSAGNPGDSSGNPRDAGDASRPPSDAGQTFGTPQVVTGLRGDAFDVQD